MTVRIIAAALVCAAYMLPINQPPAAELRGVSAQFGQGTVETFAVVHGSGAPLEIGIIFSRGALDGLPQEPNTSDRCFDLDSSGVIDAATECEGDYEFRLPYQSELADRADIPFGWAMLNWNPRGHPPAAWSVPHLDIHFYQVSDAAVDAIRLGNCGILMNCDDYSRAVKPLPARYVNADYINVEAAVGGMGNHLIDSKAPELGNVPKPFTHTWIFGAYDGQIIFHEIMVTQSFMILGSNTCSEIKQPEAWEKSGFYPTRYCFHHGTDGALKVFMEGFVMRDAS